MVFVDFFTLREYMRINSKFVNFLQIMFIFSKRISYTTFRDVHVATCYIICKCACIQITSWWKTRTFWSYYGKWNKTMNCTGVSFIFQMETDEALCITEDHTLTLNWKSTCWQVSICTHRFTQIVIRIGPQVATTLDEGNPFGVMMKIKVICYSKCTTIKLCLFTAYMVTSLLQMTGWKYWPMLGTHSHWAVRFFNGPYLL